MWMAERCCGSKGRPKPGAAVIWAWMGSGCGKGRRRNETVFPNLLSSASPLGRSSLPSQLCLFLTFTGYWMCSFFNAVSVLNSLLILEDTISSILLSSLLNCDLVSFTHCKVHMNHLGATLSTNGKTENSMPLRENFLRTGLHYSRSWWIP